MTPVFQITTLDTTRSQNHARLLPQPYGIEHELSTGRCAYTAVAWHDVFIFCGRKFERLCCWGSATELRGGEVGEQLAYALMDRAGCTKLHIDPFTLHCMQSVQTVLCCLYYTSPASFLHPTVRNTHSDTLKTPIQYKQYLPETILGDCLSFVPPTGVCENDILGQKHPFFSPRNRGEVRLQILYRLRER